jgi:hypothetical protein
VAYREDLDLRAIRTGTCPHTRIELAGFGCPVIGGRKECEEQVWQSRLRAGLCQRKGKNCCLPCFTPCFQSPFCRVQGEPSNPSRTSQSQLFPKWICLHLPRAGNAPLQFVVAQCQRLRDLIDPMLCTNFHRHPPQSVLRPKGLLPRRQDSNRVA